MFVLNVCVVMGTQWPFLFVDFITIAFMCVRSVPQAAIRKELNEFKSREMEVHEDSKQFTRYS